MITLVASLRNMRPILLPAVHMYITKVLNLGCAAALLLTVVEARAAYTLSVGTSPSQITTAGASGQSYFDVTFSQSVSGSSTWNYRNYQLQGVDSLGSQDNGLFSSLTVDAASTLKLGTGQSYLSGQTYRLIVDWTVANNAVPDTDGNGIYFNLFVKQPNAVNANAGATDVLNIQTVSVPEASQVTASALLALGGAVVYVGGRTVRRKTRGVQAPTQTSSGAAHDI
jgi:hypothetical protein